MHSFEFPNMYKDIMKENGHFRSRKDAMSSAMFHKLCNVNRGVQSFSGSMGMVNDF